MRITNTQKKELSDIFRKSGLNILDFDTSGQYQEFKVKFKYEYYSFSISYQKPDNYLLTVFPIDDTKGYSKDGATWENTKVRFEKWAKQIFTELSTPTGWETFQSENFLNADFQELEQEFIDTEKEQVRQSIKELQEKINNLKLPEPSLQAIHKKLDDLSLKVDELSKFDWKSLFVGTFASLIITLGIPPEINGIIWDYIKTAFSGLRLKG